MFRFEVLSRLKASIICPNRRSTSKEEFISVARGDIFRVRGVKLFISVSVFGEFDLAAPCRNGDQGAKPMRPLFVPVGDLDSRQQATLFLLRRADCHSSLRDMRKARSIAEPAIFASGIPRRKETSICPELAPLRERSSAQWFWPVAGSSRHAGKVFLTCLEGCAESSPWGILCGQTREATSNFDRNDGDR